MPSPPERPDTGRRVAWRAYFTTPGRARLPRWRIVAPGGAVRLMLAALAAGLMLGGCATGPSRGNDPAACPAPAPCPACPVCPAPTPEPVKPAPPPPAALFEPARFDDLPGWIGDDLTGARTALLASCPRLSRRAEWRAPCDALRALPETTAAALRAAIERHLAPWRIASPDGSTSGLVTGYYEPLLRGSRTRGSVHAHPLYATPDDLLTIDLGSLHPDLANRRLRGRIEGRRVVPYWSRAEIERGAAPLAGREIVWVDDAMEAFFLQIQGSGRVRLDSGETLRLGYADQNGHPYVPIGRVLLERGELQPGEVSMQSIQAWARANPPRVAELLRANPSYVFFRELPLADPAAGPIGSLGVPLTPERSIAIDPRYIPLAAPVFLATTRPDNQAALNRLVLAQDTGGAIRGAVRADFFWGFGAEAGELAGRMRQPGRLWLLWPRDSRPPEPESR